jgi:hypothetical protein
MSRSSPKDVAAATQKIMTAWQQVAGGATFAGMTYDQFKDKVQGSFDARDQIAQLDAAMTTALNARDDADKVTLDLNQKVVKAVVGDVAYGDNSSLYEAMGYVRASERASGLGKKTPPPAPKP